MLEYDTRIFYASRRLIIKYAMCWFHLLLGRIKGSASFFFRAGIGGRGPGGLAPFGPRGGCISCSLC